MASVTLFGRFCSFDKVQCEMQPNQMKVQHCCNFTAQLNQVPQTIVCENDYLKLFISSLLFRISTSTRAVHLMYMCVSKASFKIF